MCSLLQLCLSQNQFEKPNALNKGGGRGDRERATNLCVFQCVAVRGSVLQRGALGCSVLQRVVVWYSVL